MLPMTRRICLDWKKPRMTALLSIGLTVLSMPSLLAAPKSHQEAAKAKGTKWTEYKEPKAWPERAFPLKVFIQPLPEKAAQKQEEYKAAIRKGMEAWNATGLHGKPIFQETEDQNNANVLIGWVLDVDGERVGFERSFTLRPINSNEKFRRFNRSEITLVVNRVTTNYVPFIGFQTDRTLGPAGAGEIEIVATHELGHTLGLGHNDNSKDIMYPVETSEVVIGGFKFTNTTTFTDVSRQKLTAHYDEAFQDSLRAVTAASPAPQAPSASQIQQVPAAQKKPQAKPNKLVPITPMQMPLPTKAPKRKKG
jgi:Matrixin